MEIFAIILWIIVRIPIDFGPADWMIFNAPPMSVRLLNPPNDSQLSKELLEFGKRRPYWESIPGYWTDDSVNRDYITTAEIAQRLQELEEVNKILPPLEDVFRFRNSESLASETCVADNYYKFLAERAPFVLQEEREKIDAMIHQYKINRQVYYYLMMAQNEKMTYMDRREYLQSVKDSLGQKLYDKGIVPSLLSPP